MHWNDLKIHIATSKIKRYIYFLDINYTHIYWYNCNDTNSLTDLYIIFLPILIKIPFLLQCVISCLEPGKSILQKWKDVLY